MNTSQLPQDYVNFTWSQLQQRANEWNQMEVYESAIKGDLRCQKWILMKVACGFAPYNGSKENRLDQLIAFWHLLLERKVASITSREVVSSMREILLHQCFYGFEKSLPEDLPLGLQTLDRMEGLDDEERKRHKLQFNNVHHFYAARA